MPNFHRAIVFTKAPFTRFFRFKDLFQIYPADLNGMPISKLQRHFPVIIEYWTTEDEKIVVPELFEEIPEVFTETARKLNKLDSIISLLSICSNHLFFRYKDTAGNWTFPIFKEDAGAEANTWSSKWGFNMFIFPEMADQLKITGFTPQMVEEVMLVDHFPYYQQDPNVDLDYRREITFPETIYMDIEHYLNQPEQARTVLDTAISYALSAIELKDSKKSLSIISAFTAVETMVNYEFRDQGAEKCDTCGQLRFSVAKKYRDYLLKYIGDSNANKKKFNAYYSLRSKIVHTGQRFKTEELFADVNEEEKEKEFLNHLGILQLCRLSIVQWLLKNPVKVD